MRPLCIVTEQWVKVRDKEVDEVLKLSRSSDFDLLRTVEDKAQSETRLTTDKKGSGGRRLRTVGKSEHTFTERHRVLRPERSI